MNTPKISVIIPVFNVEKYLRQCLDSVVEQTFSDIEIICINDGSTDGSPKILQEYAARDPRTRMINQINKGLSAARNAGLKIARAEYIFFIDSDDWIEPNTLEKLLAAAERTNADLICAHFRVFAETEADQPQVEDKQKYFDQSEQTPEGGRPFSDNPRKIHVVVNGKLHKKSIIEKFALSFPAERLIYEDEYWAWAYGVHCATYFYLPEQLYNYRIHQNSITGQEINTARPLDIIDINLLTAKELQRFGLLKQHLPPLEEIFNQNLFAALFKSGIANYEKARSKMAGYLQIPGISENFSKNISSLSAAEFPLSVIIPVYNTAPWLEDCLNSLLNQSTDLFEIICVNDGSTDNSLQILEKYAANNPRIRIINQENRGSAAARNTGLAAAKGKYITFVDSDDWVEPSLVKQTFIYMQHRQLDILIFRLRKYNPQTQNFCYNPYHAFPSKLPYFSINSSPKDAVLLASLPQEACAKVYRRSFLNENNLSFCESITQGEDEIFNLQCLPYVKKYGILKENLYNYRYPREGSIMSSIKNHEPETLTTIFDLLNHICTLHQNQVDEKIKEALTARYLLHISDLIKNYPIFTNHYCYQTLRQQLKKNKTAFRKRGHLRPETYRQIKKILCHSWFRHQSALLLSAAAHTTVGKTFTTGWNFTKSYFLFPWYVYKIYKLLKNSKHF